ncbi:hypothetical protein DIPPA_63841 [Diplonema papillatum]|nr:hypothetical protein DIPPA_63841 [Diplonema papillatum]
MELWDAEMVANWIAELGPSVALYQDAFRQHVIDGVALLSLTERDLKDDLGVRELEIRRTILREVRSEGGPLTTSAKGQSPTRQPLLRISASTGYISPSAPSYGVSVSRVDDLYSGRGADDHIPPSRESTPADAVSDSYPARRPANISLSPVSDGHTSHPLTIECMCCAKRVKLYPVASEAFCTSCNTHRRWRFVDCNLPRH